MRSSALIIPLLCLPLLASAEKRKPLSYLDFLPGTWHSKRDGGMAEETWSSPEAGTMVGMFRLVENGKTRFVELLTMVERPGGLDLRIRHFDTELKPWEQAPLLYRSTRISKERVVFESDRDTMQFLEMAHDAKAQTLTITLRPRDKRKPPLEFRFSRAR